MHIVAKKKGKKNLIFIFFGNSFLEIQSFAALSHLIRQQLAIKYFHNRCSL